MWKRSIVNDFKVVESNNPVWLTTMRCLIAKSDYFGNKLSSGLTFVAPNMND